jgi:hypothetical protein
LCAGSSTNFSFATQEYLTSLPILMKGGPSPRSKTPQLDAARDRLETLTAAEAQAITEVARLTDRVAKLERLSELQSALNLVERRGALCQKIADGIKELIPLFDQYHNDAEMFVRLSRSTSAQVRSQWRLRNFLAPAANSRPFGPARR